MIRKREAELQAALDVHSNCYKTFQVIPALEAQIKLQQEKIAQEQRIQQVMRSEIEDLQATIEDKVAEAVDNAQEKEVGWTLHLP